MKKTFLLLTLVFPFFCVAQVPPGYYLSAENLNGEYLRVALTGIIRTHTVLTYTPGLWTAYYSTDVKPNGKLWDTYSDIPGGTPAYEYTMGADQCSSSSPTAEGGCYNREHTWPQSKFGSAAPMQTDLFLVYPSDYYVNSNRSDLPYGIVGTATKTFTNHSKIGNNTYTGAPAGNCYEPNDSFKGDLARTYFYISTCYRNDSAAFSNWEMATQVNLTPWTAQMLLEWHHNDPVSQKEINRNNAAYTIQGNRNPFIDRPEFADCIWGTGNCIGLGVTSPAGNRSAFSLFPNPATSEITINWNNAGDESGIKVYDLTGRIVCSLTTEKGGNKAVIPVSNLPKGMYYLQLATAGATEVQKFIVE